MNRNKKYTKKRGSKKRKTQKVRKMKGCSLGKKCRVCGVDHKMGKMCPFEKNVSDSLAGGSKGKSCPLCNVKHSMGNSMGRSVGVAGGSCGCGLPQGATQGGAFYKPAAPIPGPFVGQAWTPQVSGWPGVNGISSDRNYLADNLYPVDPQTMMQLDGGKRRVRGRRGGGLIPQDLVNLGRNISFNIGSAYNAINGYPAPVNPLPYTDQFPNSTKLIV